MVQLLLLFIRATRTTDWQLHLSFLKSMFPWFIVTDRINYSRYASSYWLEMKCLDETNLCKHVLVLSVAFGLALYKFMQLSYDNFSRLLKSNSFC